MNEPSLYPQRKNSTKLMVNEVDNIQQIKLTGGDKHKLTKLDLAAVKLHQDEIDFTNRSKADD